MYSRGIMRILVRIIEAVTEIFSGHLQAWLTFALMILVMVDVTSRYVMQNPLAISDEYGGFCLVAITCIGLAYAWKTRSHVRVEFIIKKLSPRKQRWVRLFTLFLAFAFTGFMVYGALKLVSISLMFGTRSTSWLRTPVAWPQMAIVIGAILIFLQLIVEIIKQITKLPAAEEEGE
jgi:TRAP-type C4-dicarboxylate transport system permease small subunit